MVAAYFVCDDDGGGGGTAEARDVDGDGAGAGAAAAAAAMDRKRRKGTSKGKGPKFRYDQSTDKVVSSDPMLEDPMEARYVVVGESSVAGGGQGLFAQVDLPAGAVVAYYTGLRLSLREAIVQMTLTSHPKKKTKHRNWPTYLRSNPPTPSPQCRVVWSALRCSILRADWRTFGVVVSKIGPSGAGLD